MLVVSSAVNKSNPEVAAALERRVPVVPRAEYDAAKDIRSALERYREAVNALGHNHPELVTAVSKQVGEVAHISNFFTSGAQIELAERLLYA